MVIAAIIGIASVATGIAGAASQANAQNQARASNEQYLKQQFEQDKKSYQYNWEESLRNYEHVKAQIAIQRSQEETIANLKDRMAGDEYKYNLAIRDYEYLNSLRQYQESEKIYRSQISFNRLAAEQAAQAEQDRMRETFIATAFDNQDMMVEMLQQEGLIQSSGKAGRNVTKQLQSAMAQFGRNQAVLTESLVSADRASRGNLSEIALQRYGADLSADANRMLRPTRGPDLPAPYRTPRGVFLDPLAPRKGPAPVKGVNTVQGASPLGIVSGIAGGLASGFDAYSSAKKLFHG